MAVRSPPPQPFPKRMVRPPIKPRVRHVVNSDSSIESQQKEVRMCGRIFLTAKSVNSCHVISIHVFIWFRIIVTNLVQYKRYPPVVLQARIHQ